MRFHGSHVHAQTTNYTCTCLHNIGLLGWSQGLTDGVEQAVIDDMIIFQKPFPGAARTELESQLQRAVKVSAKGKHVKRKMDLERCLFWDTAGNRVPRPAEFARRSVWLMARQWGVLFEVRHLMLEPLEAPCCPF